jgi:hypothetical protein
MGIYNMATTGDDVQAAADTIASGVGLVGGGFGTAFSGGYAAGQLTNGWYDFVGDLFAPHNPHNRNRRGINGEGDVGDLDRSLSGLLTDALTVSGEGLGMIGDVVTGDYDNVMDRHNTLSENSGNQLGQSAMEASDRSAEALIGVDRGLTRALRAIGAPGYDRSEPEYRQTFGWRLAEFSEETVPSIDRGIADWFRRGPSLP